MKLKETEFQEVDEMIQKVDSSDEMTLVEKHYKLITVTTVIKISTRSCVHSDCLFFFAYV